METEKFNNGETEFDDGIPVEELPPSDKIEILVIESFDSVSTILEKIGIGEQITASLIRKMGGLFKMIHQPLTVVCEHEYVDRVYRDLYYTYFAKKHIPYNRNCKRLTFFQGEIDPSFFYSYEEEIELFLQKRFVGLCVLRPIKSGKLGRTLLNPQKLEIPKCLLTTATFECNVLGHLLQVEAFPYSSQDTETMTCAEITVWNILEYYGTKSAEYKTILPSDIIRELEKHSSERVLPSRGLEYTVISSLFKSFGFSPKLYSRESYSKDPETLLQFKRAFHYYVESGIPLGVGISGMSNGSEAKHSVVCIGHGTRQKDLSAINLKYLNKDSKSFPYIDTAELYDDYVVMDDNKIPYRVASFDCLAELENAEVSMFAVPLYRHVFLEASDTAEIVNTVLTHNLLGISDMIPQFGESVDERNPLVIRVFLALSTNYRNFRARHANDSSIAAFYASLQLPRYVWVAEVSTYSQFKKRKIFGEMVIDATASRNSNMSSVIMVRYIDHMGFRFADDEEGFRPINRGLQVRTHGLRYPYDMYDNNLYQCGEDDNYEKL